MVLTKDEEPWGAALAVEKQHGSRAEAYVAERVAAAAQVGDGRGVETMLAIATRLDALKPGPLAS